MCELARVAFPEHPSLVDKICDYSERAYGISKKRNVLVHGYWFDMTPFDAQKGVQIWTKPDGTGDFYQVELSQIEALGEKIQYLGIEGWSFFGNPASNQCLTPAELSTLQEFHARFPPPSHPMPPIPQDPKRTGTGQKPAPFLA